MKRVIVFGGSGFLGSYVADELTRRGYCVTIADMFKTKYLKKSQKFIKVNILNLNDVEQALSDQDIVYNFVAIANLDEAIHKPIETFEINVLGNLQLLESCKNKNIKRFIYASSAYALSNQGSFYGISKHSSEKIVEEYYKRYGLKYSVIRYGSLYGERESHNNYIYNLLFDAIKNRKIKYQGDGEDIREYIHAADAARLSVDILEDSQYENEHIILTGIERLKKIELFTMINEIMQNQMDIIRVGSKEGHYKITPYAFHPNVAKKLVANPYIDLGQGLVECIQKITEKMDKD